LVFVGGLAFCAQVAAFDSLAKDPRVSQCILEADPILLTHAHQLLNQVCAGV